MIGPEIFQLHPKTENQSGVSKCDRPILSPIFENQNEFEAGRALRPVARCPRRRLTRRESMWELLTIRAFCNSVDDLKWQNQRSCRSLQIIN